MDNLAAFLVDPEATGAQVRAELERHRAGEPDPEWLALVTAYRGHVIDTIPGGVPTGSAWSLLNTP